MYVSLYTQTKHTHTQITRPHTDPHTHTHTHTHTVPGVYMV
jgi:hypothetical protein